MSEVFDPSEFLYFSRWVPAFFDEFYHFFILQTIIKCQTKPVAFIHMKSWINTAFVKTGQLLGRV